MNNSVKIDFVDSPSLTLTTVAKYVSVINMNLNLTMKTPYRNTISDVRHVCLCGGLRILQVKRF